MLILDEKVRNAITSLTGIGVPSITLFKGVDEVAITVATKTIFNINSKVLRDNVEKYVPIEGLDMISQGLTVMHYSPNRNEDIKDKDQNVSDREISMIVDYDQSSVIIIVDQRG